MKPIAEEIAELQRMAVPDLVNKYRELHGKDPHCKNKTWLWRRCAWKVQEQHHGGLSRAARRRLDALIAELDVPVGKEERRVTGRLRPGTKPGQPAVGTTLVRRWRGKDIVVHVRENGFEHEGVLYRSLSAAALAITGARWNGRLFFGLTGRAKRSPAR